MTSPCEVRPIPKGGGNSTLVPQYLCTVPPHTCTQPRPISFRSLSTATYCHLFLPLPICAIYTPTLRNGMGAGSKEGRWCRTGRSNSKLQDTACKLGWCSVFQRTNWAPLISLDRLRAAMLERDQMLLTKYHQEFYRRSAWTGIRTTPVRRICLYDSHLGLP